MSYADFKAALTLALTEAGLGRVTGGSESLDPVTLDRKMELSIEPLRSRQLAEPFFVSAAIKFEWGPLLTARGRTTEEDMLNQILTRAQVDALRDTEPPWLRLDITLRATLPFAESAPMPEPGVLRSWAHEAVGRLESIEPLLPPESARMTEDGSLEVFGWKGEPRIRALMNREGELRFDRVSVTSWQGIGLPRVWDDPDREDEPVDEQLRLMSERLRAALNAWMEVTDHLLARR